MLTLEENRLNFKTFKILSILNLIPIEINEKTGKIRRQSSKIRLFLWKILYFLWFWHWLHVAAKFILFEETDFHWDHFVFHLVSAIAFGVVYGMTFCIFIQYPEEYVMIFNELFIEKGRDFIQNMMKGERQGKKDETQAERRNENGAEHRNSVAVPAHSTVRVRPLLTWPPQYSFQDIWARGTSINLLLPAVSLLLLFLIDPTQPQLLYTSLPQEFKNPLTFISLFAVEIVAVTLGFFCEFCAIVVQILFFSKCQQELQRLNLLLKTFKAKFQNCPVQNQDRDTKRESRILSQILTEMKELVVFVEIFNRCFPSCVFLYKFFCISITIVFYFFSIRYYHDHPLVAAFTGYTAVTLSGFYIILYQKAFSIPEKMIELKNEFLVIAQKSYGNSEGIPGQLQIHNQNQSWRWDEAKREMKKIRRIGIKVGSFRTLERVY